MLAALEDGEWHERQEILSHSERFYLTNNAAAELRAKGYTIEHVKRGRDEDWYLLAARPGESVDGGLKEASAGHGPHPPAGVSLSPIFEVSEEEEWEGLRTLDEFPIAEGDGEGFAEPSSGEQLGLLGQAGPAPGAYSVEAA
jgi:hypothetical protein